MKKLIISLLIVSIIYVRGEAANFISEKQVIPAQSLISESEKNKLRFDRNYRDKSITVSGYVGDIEEKGEGYVLELYGENGVKPSRYVECLFAENQVDALLDLNKGDVFCVRGVYRGKQDSQPNLIVLFDCVEIIISMSDSDFLELCMKGSLQQIVDAINNGANVNAKSRNGMIPLMILLSRNDSDTSAVITLLELGADPKIQDDFGNTAIDYAFIHRNNDAIRDLSSYYNEDTFKKAAQKHYVSDIIASMRSLKAASLMFYVDNMDRFQDKSNTTELEIGFLMEYVDKPARFTKTPGEYLIVEDKERWWIGYNLTVIANVARKAVSDELIKRAKSVGFYGGMDENIPYSGESIVYMRSR